MVDALLQGSRQTILIVLASGVMAAVLGASAAVMQVSQNTAARRLGQGYVAVFRNVPLLVLLFFLYFGLPTILPRSQFPLIYAHRYELTVAVVAVSLVSGAFVAEVVRGGIQSIAFGQLESALASGLTHRQALQHVIFPQLGPTILPGLCNEAINIVKNSSYAMTIGVAELVWQAQQIEAETFLGFEAMTAVTLAFLVLNGAIFVLFRGLEHVFRAK